MSQIFIKKIPEGFCHLTQTTGEVIPFRDNEIPDLFETPLKKSDLGIQAFASGERSAIVEQKGIFYKLKGIVPTDKYYHEPFVPYGCLRERDSIAELNAAHIIRDFGLESNVETPIKPICHFKYDLDHIGEAVSGVVHEIKSDARLTDYYKIFENTISSHKGKKLSESGISRIREEFTNKIGKWMGFWYGALEKSDLSWGTNVMDYDRVDTNIGIHNVIVYPYDDGFGIALADLDKSKKNPLNLEREFELRSIYENLRLFDGFLYFIKNSTDNKVIWDFQCNQLRFAIMKNIRVLRGELNEQERDLINWDHEIPYPLFRDLPIIENFERGRKGEIPEPIDREFFTNMEKKMIEILK